MKDTLHYSIQTHRQEAQARGLDEGGGQGQGHVPLEPTPHFWITFWACGTQSSRPEGLEPTLQTCTGLFPSSVLPYYSTHRPKDRPRSSPAPTIRRQRETKLQQQASQHRMDLAAVPSHATTLQQRTLRKPNPRIPPWLQSHHKDSSG